MASSRKRRRSVAFPRKSIAQLELDDAANDGEDNAEGVDAEEQDPSRMQDLWDAFSEEFHETMEQLPLSLHRLFTLLREQDMKTTADNEQLLAGLQQYITLRRIAAGQIAPSEEKDPSLPEAAPDPDALPVLDLGHMSDDASRQSETSRPSRPERRVSARLNRSPSKKSISPSKRSRQGTASASSSPVTPFTVKSAPARPAKPPPSPPPTTRDILMRIATLMDDLVLSSHEKANLAKAAYDSVDRHVRLLDQAIKDQETAIQYGNLPGLHVRLLPPLAAPRPTRPVRFESSPLLEPEAAPEAEAETVPPKEKGRAQKRRKTSVSAEPEEARQGRPLKLRIPPRPSTTVPAGEQVNPNEPRYCYCNDVSHGEMVACDNDDCPIEWFHLKCVGLSAPPAENESWYCRNCKEPSIAPKRKGR